MKQLKYGNEISKTGCVDCPPNDSKEVNMTAFRFCFNPFSQNCFLPVLVIEPDRELGDKKCSGFALSMYNDLAKCKRRFARLSNNNQRTLKMGDHIAVGILTNEHGLCTPVDKTGHFDLHEYAQGNVASVFTVQCAAY